MGLKYRTRGQILNGVLIFSGWQNDCHLFGFRMVGTIAIAMPNHSKTRTNSKSKLQNFHFSSVWNFRPHWVQSTNVKTFYLASLYKMLHKLIYTKKLLHICRLVDTNLCERCIKREFFLTSNKCSYYTFGVA